MVKNIPTNVWLSECLWSQAIHNKYWGCSQLCWAVASIISLSTGHITNSLYFHWLIIFYFDCLSLTWLVLTISIDSLWFHTYLAKNIYNKAHATGLQIEDLAPFMHREVQLSTKASNVVVQLQNIYQLPVKLWEGNVFSHVCLSFCPQGGPALSLPWCIGPHNTGTN